MSEVVVPKRKHEFMSEAYIAALSDYVLIGKLRQCWGGDVMARLRAEAKRRGVI